MSLINLMMSDFTCNHCNKTFSAKKNLEAHIKNAKYCIKIRENTNIKTNTSQKEPENEIVDSLKKEIDNLKKEIIQLKSDLYNQNLYHEKENKILEDEISKLKHDLDNQKQCYEKEIKHVNELTKFEKEIAFKDGKISELSKNKPGNNTYNTYINPKLASIPISNIPALTIDYVQDNIEKFTFNKYINGVAGVSEFMSEIVTLQNANGETELNYACTDKARDSFFILQLIDQLGDNDLDNDNAKKKWASDGKAKFINKILDTLKPLIKNYRNLLNEKMLTAVTEDGQPDWFSKEHYAKLSTDLIDFNFGILDNKIGARSKLMVDIRNYIKNSLAV